jgi:hypothetical protein
MTPGSKPFEAAFLKHSRHMPNFLRKARGLPQRGHRLYFLVENLGLRLAFAIKVFLATVSPLNYFLNGIPNAVSSALLSSSLAAVVQIVTESPRTLSIFS